MPRKEKWLKKVLEAYIEPRNVRFATPDVRIRTVDFELSAVSDQLSVYFNINKN